MAGISLMCLDPGNPSKYLSIRVAWTSYKGSKRQELGDARLIKDYARNGHSITLPYSINQS